jgi:hypothetical protein
MGQATSRQRSTLRQTQDRSNRTTSGSSSQAESPRREPESTQTIKRSRRESLRRSIIGLIPSSSSRSSKDSIPSEQEPSQPSRKRWRSSRRFSKSPAHLTNLNQDSQQLPTTPEGDRETIESESPPTPASGVALGAHPQICGSTSSPVASGSSTPHLTGQDDKKNPAQSSSPPSRSDLSSPTPLPTVLEQPAPTSTFPTTEEIRREVAEFLTGQAEPPSTAAPAAVDSGTSDRPAEPPAPSIDTANTTQPLPQTFPPPGTLVVVQGVVNTTDTPHPTTALIPPPASTPSVPTSTTSAADSPLASPPIRRRASSVSTPHPSSRMLSADERNSTRNRLSSLIRPSRGTPEHSLYSHSASTPLAELAASRVPSDSSSSSATSVNDTSATPDNTSTSRGLSPGSIDVLGTLLRYVAYIDEFVAVLYRSTVLQQLPPPPLYSPPTTASTVPTVAVPLCRHLHGRYRPLLQQGSARWAVSAVWPVSAVSIRQPWLRRMVGIASGMSGSTFANVSA